MAKTSKSNSPPVPKFIRQNLLEAKKKPKCCFTDVSQIREKCFLPDDAEILIPSPSIKPDSVSEGWIGFFEYPFRIGHVLPFGDLTKEFLTHCNVSPCQFMPHVWRLLLGLEVLLENKKEFGLEFSLRDLASAYDWKNYGTARVNLVPKDGKTNLIVNLDKTNDRGWEKRYFFIKKSSLGSECSYLSEKWVRGIEHLPGLPEGNELSKSRIEAILQIPEVEWTFSSLKGQRLQSLGEVELSVDQSAEIKEEEEEIEEEVPLIRKSKRGSSRRLDFSYVDPKQIQTIDDESSDESTVVKMSNTPKSNQAPSFHELRERAKRQKSSHNSANPTPVSSQASLAVLPVMPALTEPPKPITLTLPANLCNFKGGTKSVKSDLNQFLFPTTKEYLKKFKHVNVLTEAAASNLQAVQSILTIKEHLGGLERQLSSYRASDKSLRERLNANEATIKKLDENNKKLIEYAKKKKTEALDAGAYYAVKTRSEVIQEFKDRKADSWDVESEVGAFEDLYGNASPPGVDDGIDFASFKVDLGLKRLNEGAREKKTA